MDITYKYFPSNKKKSLEVFADADKYGKALRMIGCRRSTNFDGWTLPSESEEKLIILLKKLGVDHPENQKTNGEKKVEPVVEKKEEVKKDSESEKESDSESEKESDESDESEKESDESESEKESEKDESDESDKESEKDPTPPKKVIKNVTPNKKGNAPRKEKVQSPVSRKKTNSPSSRKALFNKSSPTYKKRHDSVKIEYYKGLGKKHIQEIDDSSTEPDSDTSDDYPNPKRSEDLSREDIERMKRRLRDLESSMSRK